MQYQPPEELPAAYSWGGPTAAPDGTLYALTSRKGVPYFASRAPGAGWQFARIDDNKGFATPRGYPLNRNGLGAGDLAIGAHGFVTFGSTNFWTPGFYSATSLGIVHASRDGRSWKRVDLRPFLGASRSVDWGTLTATNTGYLLAVATSNVAESTRSEIVVLTSTDGTTWKETATVHGQRWSVVPTSVQPVGDRLLMSGYEWACETNSLYFATFSVAAMLRYWTSDDGGRSWQALTLPDGVVTSKEPNPTEATCRGVRNSLQELNDRFASSGGIIGVANGTAVALTGPGDSQTQTSRDLKTWTTGDLPGAIPLGADPATFKRDGANLVFADRDGITLLSTQNARHPDNTAFVDTAAQVLGWHTLDGQHWTAYPLAMPMLGKPFYGSVGADGVARYVDTQAAAAGQSPGTFLHSSMSGPFIPWGSCTVQPQADCRFVTLSGAALAGVAAPGIDFTGGRMESGDLSGANLSGAQLPNVYVGVNLAHANLSGANARATDFAGDLTGAIFDGADLTGAFVETSFLSGSHVGAILHGLNIFLSAGDSLADSDFSGQDLQGVSFNAYVTGDPISMRNADFSGANLDDGGFTRVDLTGANFTGTSVKNLSISEDSICPSGKPPKKVDFRPTCGDLTP